MQRRRSTISADWKKKRGESIDAAPTDIRLTSAGWRVKATTSRLRPPALALRRAGVATHVLHDRDRTLDHERNGLGVGTHAVACRPGCCAGGAESRGLLSKRGRGATLPSPSTGAPGLTQAGVLPQWHLVDPCLSDRGCSGGETAEVDVSAMLSDNLAGRLHHLRPRGLSHLNCHRPRTLSAEERTLLFVYCPDHWLTKCAACAGNFRLRDLASDLTATLLSGHAHLCPWCRRDLTDSVRVHLYGCMTLPT